MPTDIDLWGKDVTHDRLREGYETHPSFDKQGDKRTIKVLQFPVHVRTLNPMFPDAEVVQERLLRRGDTVSVEELGLVALEKGERLGAFYTDAELAAGVHRLAPGAPIPVNSAELAIEQANPLGEQGAAELVLWLSGNQGDQSKAPTVDEVLAEVGGDKDLAKRMIEAENLRSPDDPRRSLVDKLTRVAESD